MSLILEALKKVERERATPEQRGFLVLGPAAWAPSRSNLAWVLGMVSAAAVAGGAVYVMTRPPASAAVPPPPQERSAHAPAPQSAEARTDVPPAATGWGPPPDSSPPRARPAADPATATPAATLPADPALTLHAISVQDGVPVAVVNDRVVREGDRFDGVRILRIGAAEVEIDVNGIRRTLRF